MSTTTERTSIAIEQELKKLAWACRRGMLELDLILQPFYQYHYANLSVEQQEGFKALLACDDPDLFRWFIGQEEPAEPKLANIITLIKRYCYENE